MVKIRRMFPGGSTGEGFYSFHQHIFKYATNKIYILKGGPGVGKSTIMNNIAEKMIEKGYIIEYHHCPSDENSIDGLVIKDLKVAIVDGTYPHIIDPKMPGIKDKIVDLGSLLDENILIEQKKNIAFASEENKKCYRKVYRYFKCAKEIQDELDDVNEEKTNLMGINCTAYSLLNEIYGSRYVDDRPYIRHLFGSAYTPSGFVDYTDTLINSLSRVYYIKGEYEGGKAYLLDRVSKEGMYRGFDIEVFHNPLNPKKIDTVIIPYLDIGLTTSNHAMDNNTKIIDFDEFLSIDKNYLDEYNEDKKFFYDLLSKGIESLKKAKYYHDILEKSYAPAMNFSKIEDIEKNIIEEIMQFSEY
jgi:hypothetical protein